MKCRKCSKALLDEAFAELNNFLCCDCANAQILAEWKKPKPKVKKPTFVNFGGKEINL